MTQETSTVLFNASKVFPDQIKAYPVKACASLPAGKALLLNTQVKLPVSDSDFQQLIYEIAGYLSTKVDGTVYSYFAGDSQQGTAAWQFCSCRLNKDGQGEPAEVVVFTYDLELLGDARTRIYNILEQDNFFKMNYNKAAALTRKEKEIIGLLAQGMNSKEIAGHTFTSVHTVNTHRQHIHEKLGIKNIHSLLQFAEAFNLTGKKIKI